jgi:hypothetical protein
MKKRIAMLLAVGIGLAAAVSAHAQVALNWSETPPSLAAPKEYPWPGPPWKQTYDESRSVAYDYLYPPEYKALGGNGVLVVSVATNDSSELPIKRAFLRFGGKEVPLQLIADRRSQSPGSSPGGRDDAIFLLPVALPGRKADLWVFFARFGKEQRLKGLTFKPPRDPIHPAAAPPGPPDETVLKAVLAKRYPTLVKP